jgi:hypothetical protein
MLEVVALDAGHAVNLDAASAFNDAVVGFFRRSLERAAPQSTSTQ